MNSKCSNGAKGVRTHERPPVRVMLVVLVAGIASSACEQGRGGADTPVAVDTPNGAAVADISCDGFVAEALSVRARTRAEFRSELGEPDRVEAETEPNRHDPSVTDSIFRIHHPGLVAQIRRPPAGGDMLERVEVSDNRFLAYPSLGVGAPAERITFTLGPPRERTNGRLVYECGAQFQPEEPVIFHLEGDDVVELWFTRYVD
jgi:hypothetical protein